MAGVTDRNAKENIRQSFAADMAEINTEYKSNMNSIVDNTPKV
jgi:hypothetical protein